MPEPEPGATLSRDQVRSRRITTEDMVRNQLDRISSIRVDVARESRIEAWSEALEALHDLTIPWHDATFRKEWEERPVAFVRLKGGERLISPCAKDCRTAQIILMRMLDRAELLVRRRNTSGPAPRTFAVAAGSSDKEAEDQDQEGQNQVPM